MDPYGSQSIQSIDPNVGAARRAGPDSMLILCEFV